MGRIEGGRLRVIPFWTNIQNISEKEYRVLELAKRFACGGKV